MIPAPAGKPVDVVVVVVAASKPKDLRIGVGEGALTTEDVELIGAELLLSPDKKEKPLETTGATASSGIVWVVSSTTESAPNPSFVGDAIKSKPDDVTVLVVVIGAGTVLAEATSSAVGPDATPLEGSCIMKENPLLVAAETGTDVVSNSGSCDGAGAEFRKEKEDAAGAGDAVGGSGAAPTFIKPNELVAVVGADVAASVRSSSASFDDVPLISRPPNIIKLFIFILQECTQ